VTIRGLPDKETANSPWRGCFIIDKGVIILRAEAKADFIAGVLNFDTVADVI
jgi:hypothetical protein